jgi:hypothetical protein
MVNKKQDRTFHFLSQGFALCLKVKCRSALPLYQRKDLYLDELSEKLIETAVKETIQPIYQDTLSPALLEIGKIAQDAVKTIRLFTAPIQYGAYLQNRLEQHLEKSLQHIPKENLVTPHNSIQMPIFEQLKNYDKEEQYNEAVIVAMYQNLLSSAYNKDTSPLVHPRFTKIISDLSSDEAMLFNYTCKGQLYCSHFSSLVSHVKKVQNKEYIKMYFNNLQQLGLINILNYTDVNNFENSYDYNSDNSITIHEDKIYEVTEFGLLFHNIVNTQEKI